ncbi:hypothetical protein [Agrobacterium rosae]|uniref:Uncharacterized protein n=1 Tax=Agrobacterium rosae TaxID=1972867 RepID=A0AAW9FBD0_9HYPH|nr:hypothetical protein [Agrobacterium rosae]MDX8302805.1 hypothetical protein [Agrobacterium rosae]
MRGVDSAVATNTGEIGITAGVDGTMVTAGIPTGGTDIGGTAMASGTRWLHLVQVP